MADMTIAAASVVPSSAATIIDGTAGEAVALGQLVYADSTTNPPGRFKLADADALASSKCVGMAVTGASAAGQPIRILTEDTGLTIGGTQTVGGLCMVSTTAGGMTLTAADITTGDYVTVVGVTLTATTMYFRIIYSGITRP